MRGNTLIIVLPCFNEEEVLPITIARMSDLLERMIAGNKVSDDSNKPNYKPTNPEDDCRE